MRLDPLEPHLSEWEIAQKARKLTLQSKLECIFLTDSTKGGHPKACIPYIIVEPCSIRVQGLHSRLERRIPSLIGMLRKLSLSN
jgi:hypothetical protein